MSSIKYFLASLFILCAVSSCNRTRDADEIYLGTLSGPESALVKMAQKIAKNKYGLKIKIIEFEDYNIPNLALNDGSIDANMFQHQPYLDLAIEHKGYALKAIGKTFIYPMGAYSKKHQTVEQLPQGAKVAIPIDPSNGARALRLLAKYNLISIPDVSDIELNKRLIKHNPKNISIIEMDSAQLPRVLADVDMAIINTNFAIPAGLKPTENALLLEDKDSPYANIVVIRTQDEDNPKFGQLMESLHDKEVVELAETLFDGQAIVAWE